MKKQLTAALGGVCLAAIGTANAAVWAEVGDAGDIVGGAPQVASGIGLLDTITGSTDVGAGDTVDAYIINVSDPAIFYATTDSTYGLGTGSASFDTRLFLFDLTGAPVLANDDSGGPGATSTLTTPALYPGSVAPTAPASIAAGDYILAISGWAGGGGSNVALDGGGIPVLDIDSSFGSLHGANPASSGPIASWSAPGSGGAYTIELAGASLVPEPSAGVLGLMGFAMLLRRRRR